MCLPFFIYIYIYLSFTLYLSLPPFLSVLNLFLFLCSITYLSISFLFFPLLLLLFRLGATSLYNCNKFWPVSKICRVNRVRMETPLWICLSFLSHLLTKALMDSLYLLCYRYCTTVCPRSSDPFHIVTCYFKMGNDFLDTQYNLAITS